MLLPRSRRQRHLRCAHEGRADGSMSEADQQHRNRDAFVWIVPTQNEWTSQHSGRLFQTPDGRGLNGTPCSAESTAADITSNNVNVSDTSTATRANRGSSPL